MKLVVIKRLSLFLLFAIISETTLAQFSVTKTDVTCFGSCDGTAQIQPNGNYRYLWNTTDSTQSLSALCEGSYSCTVSDSLGNSIDTLNVTILEPPALSAFILSSTDIRCNTPGLITISISGGTPPYLVHWGNGNTSYQMNQPTGVYVLPGFYQILITDASNCSVTIMDTIMDFRISISLSEMIEPLCDNPNSGAIKTLISGGGPPYSYMWSNGATTDSITNIPVGAYGLTVTDTTGCNQTETYTLTGVVQNSSYYVYVDGRLPNCGDNGVLTANPYDGIPPYSYTWNTTDTTQILTNLGAGNYSVTVTDSLGCSRFGSYSLQSICTNIITGVAFYDANGNCSFDTMETPVSNVIITAQKGNRKFYGSTNINGEYSINVADSGTFDLYISTGWGQCVLEGCSISPINFNTLGDISFNNDIGLTGLPNYDLHVHPGWNSANPGFQKKYWILYKNQSPNGNILQATITFVYDSILDFQYSNPPPTTHDTLTHTLTWTVNSIPSYSWNWSVAPYSYFMVPANLPVGYMLQSDFYISPTLNDCDSTNNYLHVSQVVTGSRDPNAKEVSPEGDIFEEDSILTYTIHFQNNGNDTTHFIIIKDTLSPTLDASTVQTLASSHSYTDFKVEGEGILTWIFNPIYLPDSLTDESGSKGFVTFKVKKVKNLALQTEIANRAAIYFDYNPAVITNTVVSTMSAAITNLNESNSPLIPLEIFPNPASSQLRIQVFKSEFYLLAIRFFNITSQEVLSVQTFPNSRYSVLDIQNLSTGIYFCQVTLSNGYKVVRKIVIE